MRRNSTIGDVIIELIEIDSTNNYAMRLLNEGMAEHGMAIRADFQSNGKGQHGNVWHAEECKNLLLSVILDTHSFSLDKLFYFNAFSCICIADLLMSVYNLRDISIKWPNDIYAGDKKIAGILIENNIRGTTWTNAIIGIGLNVNQTHFTDLHRATSIAIESALTVKINLVLENLLKSMNKFIHRLDTNPEELLKMYNASLYKLNKQISFSKNSEMYTGKLVGVNESGQIEIEVKNNIQKFKHKEIEFILD